VAAAVRKALEGLGTPRAEEALVVALSGGPDSVALADALARAAAVRGFRVVAAHLDHGLRPGSADDARFCAALAGRLGIAFRSACADVAAARRGRGLEEAARDARYAFLREVAREAGARFIAVAHTRDDQAETVLLRLLRGSGSQGLAAMPPRSGALLRPLLGVSRLQVMDYLAARGLEWREDPSNADQALLRNRVRRELIPYLESRFNPSLRATLARSAAILADEADALASEAGRLLAAVRRSDADGVLLSRDGLRAAPRAVARLALRQALEQLGGRRGVGAVHVERLLDMALRSDGALRRLELPGGREALARFGLLRLGPRRAATSASAQRQPRSGIEVRP
jgi:tRNA(Ile)-lysidine synthase